MVSKVHGVRAGQDENCLIASFKLGLSSAKLKSTGCMPRGFLGQARLPSYFLPLYLDLDFLFLS